MLPGGSKSSVLAGSPEDKQRSWEVFIFSVGESFSPQDLSSNRGRHLVAST